MWSGSWSWASLYSNVERRKVSNAFEKSSESAASCGVCVFGTGRIRARFHWLGTVECSRNKPPFSFVKGQDSTVWDTGSRPCMMGRAGLAPQCLQVDHVHQFLLQAPQSLGLFSPRLNDSYDKIVRVACLVWLQAYRAGTGHHSDTHRSD